MIRPFTLICMASAFGAGLYLYQSKHAAQVLDREIGRTIKQAEQTRERTGMLKAEWALLNEPDRLAELARAHLALQTLKPTQFAAAADLASRLPAVRMEALPVDPAPEDVPVAQSPPPPPVTNPVTAAAAPKPAEPVRVAEPKPKPEPKVAESKPARPPAEHVARLEPPREPVPVHAREASPPPSLPTVNSDAIAPGTVGAAVLRAMRAQNAGFAAAPAPPPVRTYAAAPPSEPPPPAYAPPAAMSVLGGRPALPPPVPFAAR